MGIHRLKHSCSAGEITPLLHDRVDFERYKNGCKIMENMVSSSQGPAIRRPGTEFIYDLTELGIDVDNPLIREIPFIYSQDEAYAMIFFMHTDGYVRLVFGTTKTDGSSGLVVFDDPAGTECPSGTVLDPVPTPDDVVVVTMPEKWDIMNFDWAQTNNEMYIAQSGLQPHVITRETNECWFVSSITMTSQPADWSEDYGWPEKVTFHQQRLAFAANTLRPQTVWMSVAGYNNFHNFGELDTSVTETEDADAITFTLDSQTQNKIRWISSGKALHIGTLGNEWTVVGNSETSLTPSNILATRQTNNGSEANKALLIGLTTLFVERHGRVVNEFKYDYTYDSYRTDDMAILASHMTESHSIIDWSYQQTPESIIWCVREDGLLMGITYQRQHKIVAWHRHPTQGEVQTVTAIPGNTREDDVWVTVMREVAGETKYYVEKMADWFYGDETTTGRFLDSFQARTADGGLVSTIYTPHLAGLEVHILADGTVHPPVVAAVDDGKIELNGEYGEIVAGLQYISELRPNLVDVPQSSQNAASGTSLGRVQRTTAVNIDFYKTLGGYIGRFDEEDGEHEEELPFRVPSDLLGTAVPLSTGWYNYDFPEGFDREPTYFIRQKQPLPMTVRGIVDISEVLE